MTKIQMEGLICTTSAPTRDGMFVLGHAENSQTSDPFAFSSNLISLFTLFTFQNLNHTFLYYIHKYTRPDPPESILKVVFKEFSIHGSVQQIAL